MFKMRAKFMVSEIVSSRFPTRKLVQGEYQDAQAVHHTLRATPVCTGSEENHQFWEATPDGQLELVCVDKKALERFQPGQEFYLDFIPVEEELVKVEDPEEP